MEHKYNISICLPAMRTKYWREFYDTACLSCKDKSFEIVFCGPYGLPEDMKALSNIKFIQDFGSPTRCMQIAASHCEGEILANASDDGIFVEEALSKSVDLYSSVCKDGDGIILRYTEGTGRPTYTPSHANDDYWRSKYHGGFNGLKGVKDHFKHGTWMVKLSEFIRIGGLDCKYGSMAFSSIDFLHRMQNQGGTMHLSPTFVQNLDWDPSSTEYQFVQNSTNEGYTLYVNDYKEGIDRYIIPFDNWKNSPEKWARFL